jgi:hypothetical protein
MMDSCASLMLGSADPSADPSGEGRPSPTGVPSQPAAVRLRTDTTAAAAARTLMTGSYRNIADETPQGSRHRETSAAFYDKGLGWNIHA